MRARDVKEILRKAARAFRRIFFRTNRN
jgi:hypothetical protein